MKPLLAIKKENVDLEKQVNRLNNLFNTVNSTKLVLLFLFLGSAVQVNAQDRVPFDQGKTYILKKVSVTGKITYNEQTIVTFAGLTKGESITIPGEEISNSIKKLWKLGLYNDVNFYIDKIEGDSISLELNINELPKLKEVKFIGIKKGKLESITKDTELTPEKIVNENLITTTKNYIENKYKKEGYYNTKVNIATTEDTETINHVNMVVNVDKGKKVKVSKITVNGNTQFTDEKIRSAMKNTKQQSVFRILKSSKYIKDKYKEDLTSIINKYKENGYRDARIISDSVTYEKEKNTVAININVEEGNKYYFGDIKFLGNTIYNDQLLGRVLGIKKGDVYNGVLLEKRIADKSSPDSEDLTNLYQNNGYLFSTINPVEVSTANNIINMEIRVTEGPLAYFNKISVVGNDKTNDKVIYRELRTKPGNIYSKETLIRTIREIGQLGFFDPESIKPDFENVDPAAGTVDIKYHLVEKGASQIELQGGYGGGGFIGTLGLSFNNFSIGNIFNKKSYRPLPMGDGQKVSLRLQASTNFQTYSFSFSEPWFGGKKPISFSTSLAFTKQFGYDLTYRTDKSKYMNIFSASIGIAKKLEIPDDYFVLSHAISYQHYDLNNYYGGLFTFANGASRNLAYTIGISRNSKGNNPIFPTYGSDFSLTGKFTLPYSSFSGINYSNLENLEEYKKRDTNGARSNQLDGNGNVVRLGDYLDANGNKVDNYNLAAADNAKVDQKKYNWLEYYKIKFKAEWFTTLYGKLVLRTLGEFGYLGAYNQGRGIVPFERFVVGGNGLGGNYMTSNENIQVRGYKDNGSLSVHRSSGDPIYNKFSLELRYPITLKQAASIYALSFVEGAGSYDNFKTYNPFILQRSAGVGLRVFMPAFGLLGIDFGHGFDAPQGSNEKNGWETHFIIGQQF
ncbi:outer membrane protein assembly factor BamA [Flavobacterium psychrophilum]|uniref:outer membrane protein assembly factor BamA n=1 Tax=Flavobacterium psychrophilum TaxID=96345 RepID=UPI00141B5EBF|nr:outer membrane protein assembly factor BamA [Flavobacterium psychrophilum]